VSDRDFFLSNLKRLVLEAHIEMLEEVVVETKELARFLSGDKPETEEVRC